jgi:hypothetical protein
MSLQPIPIEKKEFIQVLEATGFKIEVTNMELNKSVTILISFYSEYGLIKTDTCIITQPEYDEWTTDEWLITYVVNKYGLVLKSSNL